MRVLTDCMHPLGGAHAAVLDWTTQSAADYGAPTRSQWEDWVNSEHRKLSSLPTKAVSSLHVVEPECG
jgi:hypothetical protein